MSPDPREIAQRIIDRIKVCMIDEPEHLQDDWDDHVAETVAILAAEMPRWVPQKFVHCDNCGVVEYLIDEMEASGENTHDAQDVLCAKCRLVICTFHESQSPPSPPREEAP